MSKPKSVELKKNAGIWEYVSDVFNFFMWPSFGVFFCYRGESSFLKEIPDSFIVKTSIPLPSIVEEVRTCRECFSQLEKLWKVCPYCGEPVGE